MQVISYITTDNRQEVTVSTLTVCSLFNVHLVLKFMI